MDNTHTASPGGRALLTTAAFVVVVAGMKAASPILVPFLLSVFIALICSPALFWLQRKRVPDVIAILLILTVVIGAGWLLGTLIGKSVNEFVQSAALAKTKLAIKTDTLLIWLADKGLEVSDDDLREQLNPGKAIQMAASTLSGLKSALTNTFFIMLTVVFILLEASGFPRKLQAAFNTTEERLEGFSHFSESVQRYIGIKTLFSAMTGFLVWVWLRILDVDFAMVWGLLAFLLNYIPSIGSILAAIPAVLMALVQFDTGGRAVMVALGYIVLNILIGSLTEPRFMGRELGLSTLVVFLSLIFWGWVLGPVGMLLSVPLTMILKIALASSEEARWISVLLGPDPGRYRSKDATAGDTGP